MLKAGIFNVEMGDWAVESCVIIVPLHPTIDEYDIKLKAEKFGKVSDIDIRKSNDGKPRRALVRFAFVPSVKCCSKALNGKVWRGAKTMVYTMDFWKLREKIDGETRETSNRKVFVAGLPYSASRHIISRHFSKYGEVEKVTLKTDRRGMRIAFVLFQEEYSKDMAISSAPMDHLNGKILQISKITAPAALKPPPRAAGSQPTSNLGEKSAEPKSEQTEPSLSESNKKPDEEAESDDASGANSAKDSPSSDDESSSSSSSSDPGYEDEVQAELEKAEREEEGDVEAARRRRRERMRRMQNDKT